MNGLKIFFSLVIVLITAGCVDNGGNSLSAFKGRGGLLGHLAYVEEVNVVEKEKQDINKSVAAYIPKLSEAKDIKQCMAITADYVTQTKYDWRYIAPYFSDACVMQEIDSECSNLGFRHRTDAFAMCRLQLKKERQQYLEVFANNVENIQERRLQSAVPAKTIHCSGTRMGRDQIDYYCY